jgi:hypothetical protein
MAIGPEEIAIGVPNETSGPALSTDANIDKDRWPEAPGFFDGIDGLDELLGRVAPAVVTEREDCDSSHGKAPVELSGLS